MMTRPEILAPAGNAECLDFALMYGADAVYLAGSRFGMRAGADNFTPGQLHEAVGKAHAKGVKVYLTCNTVARSYEHEMLEEHLACAKDCGVDALIISDLGVMRMAKRLVPDIPVHVSTQTGVASWETAMMLYELGARRVVLARELSLPEIAAIRDNCPADLEIECFAHGSMCVSFSGRCLLSNYLTGRDANRGECAQPCRWKYVLMEETREGQYFPVFEDDNGTHILNSRDMCMIEHIPELVKAGVSSIKLEGRAKSSYYVAVVTNAYRCAAEEYAASPTDDFRPSQWICDEVMKVSHREYSTGFYFGNEPGQVYENGGYVREYEVAAVVSGWKDGVLTVSQRNRFVTGDELEALCPGERPRVITAANMTDADGEPIDAAPHPTMTVSMPCAEPLPAGALLRRKK